MIRRTRSLRPTSICGPATATRSADGAVATATIAPAARKSREIGLRHIRQVALVSHHIVAEQMPERRVQSRPAGGIEQRRDISERVARHEKRDPVDMRPLM